MNGSNLSGCHGSRHIFAKPIAFTSNHELRMVLTPGDIIVRHRLNIATILHGGGIDSIHASVVHDLLGLFQGIDTQYWNLKGSTHGTADGLGVANIATARQENDAGNSYILRRSHQMVVDGCLQSPTGPEVLLYPRWRPILLVSLRKSTSLSP